MVDTNDPRIYKALVLPEQALGNGGTEILRAGIIDDELYMTALPAFDQPGQWGEVLAEMARRLGGIYAARSPGGLSQKDATVQIAEAFAAEMGAREVKAGKSAKKAAKKTVKKPAKTSAKPSTKTSPKKRKR